MKKLPYFEWYPADCDTDENVKGMDDREIGFYLRCLNHSWINGSIPADPGELARVMSRSPHYVRQVWQRVGRCFKPGSDPLRLVNGRQEEQRARARLLSLRNTNNAISGHQKVATARSSHRNGSTTRDIVLGIGVDVGLTQNGSRESLNAREGANPLYDRYHDLIAQWDHPDDVDMACRIWISLVDAGEITGETISKVFDGLDIYNASKKVAKGYKMSVSKWLSGRRWKDRPEPATGDEKWSIA
jgi:uncharacterized protein YdaU (DUF1376 family)